MSPAAPDGAAHSPPIRFSGRVRIGWRLCLMIGALALCLPLHFLARIAVRHSPFPRLFLFLFARIAGARVEVIGTPLRRDVFFLANHVSWLDIPALAGASGTAFVAKAEIARAPLVGWLCRLNRTVFVQREARLDVAAQVNALREALAGNWSVAVFPEGTTTDGRSLLPFKTSMLKVLEPPPAGVMVQPVLLDYGALAPMIGWVGEEPGTANAAKILARRGTFPVRACFLEPFAPADFPGRKAIAAEARARIEAALVETLGGDLRPYGHDVAAVRYAAPGQEAHDRAEG